LGGFHHQNVACGVPQARRSCPESNLLCALAQKRPAPAKSQPTWRRVTPCAFWMRKVAFRLSNFDGTVACVPCSQSDPRLRSNARARWLAAPGWGSRRRAGAATRAWPCGRACAAGPRRVRWAARAPGRGPRAKVLCATCALPSCVDGWTNRRTAVRVRSCLASMQPRKAGPA
jgi:hypothetical protein